MSNLNDDQKGFGAVEGLLVLVIVAALAGVGWFVWSQNTSSKTPVAVTPVSSVKTCTTRTSTLTKGWTEYKSKSNGYCLKFNPKWKVNVCASSTPASSKNNLDYETVNADMDATKINKCLDQTVFSMPAKQKFDSADPQVPAIELSVLVDTAPNSRSGSKVAVEVDGVKGYRLETVNPRPKTDELAVGALDKIVYYEFMTNNRQYGITYNQFNDRPDLLKDFEAMVKDTLSFSK